MRHRVLLTGGSRGIGAAIAARFRAEGHDVFAPTRQEVDLASLESIQAFIRGRAMNFDVLVNNAGQNKIGTVAELALEDWTRMQTINLTAPFLLLQACIPHMKQQNWGRVVNISSVFSLVTSEGRPAYSASKAGLNALTRTAALELSRHNILVNAVCPGYISTDMTRQNNPPEALKRIVGGIPAGRLGTPEEIAEFVAFLASEKNGYMSGQTVVVDGGFSCQ